MLRQRTLKTLVRTTGVGLHTGAKVGLVLRPAAPDTGIVFRRVDLDPPVDIRADPCSVGDTRLASSLEVAGVRIGTVEHLMSALCGLGIDNAWVDVDAPELPILDGSAAPFVYLVNSAGIEEQPAAKRFLRVKRPIEVREADKWARLDPYEGFRVSFSIAFQHPVREADKWARLDPYEGFRVSFSIAFQHPVLEKAATSAAFDFAEASYVQELARARTFGFMHEVEHMHEQGLALGGSLENAVVMDEYRVLNADGLRIPAEFVRHKLLDAVGDLYLLGHPLLAAFSAHKSGHALNNRLLRALLAEKDAWEMASFADAAAAPARVARLFALQSP